ncbi:hypothetical protein JANAI62_02920 [Jannaschia pagri]|uniref:DUF3859 domain-containing protein n=1 Tax=Jannaschia pagri TaxID=2829797 RepID=A0ABQ4NGX3_9RHOB|nr:MULTISPECIES: DUF3859 domain-containing protein [unclassified Jannaschia]GIT90225.1 hypothetical protein JANAI61_06830 [Jannaschia sp. AI_61]GIT93669.1 hypothetical protein JANAI62_02920 [Jannaschia sp. AI_62]
MRYRLTSILTLGLALWGEASSAQVRLLETGILCPRISSGELIEAPGTEAGVIRRIDQGLGFDLPGRTVPIMDNLGFGFRIALKDGASAQDVTIVVTHPPMGAAQVTRQEWADTIWPGETNLNLFTFEEDYEKVPGPWTFSAEIDGETLVEVPFTVTEDGGRGPVEAACFRFMS